MSKFSLSNLEVFERPGVTITSRGGDDWRAGCRVTFPDGWALSIQWGAGNYGSNYDVRIAGCTGVPDATEAEIAVIRPNSGNDLARWVDGDVVQGWCSMERVQRILDLMAEGKLMRKHQEPAPPPEMRADDSIGRA